jgi:hypothetical protein
MKNPTGTQMKLQAGRQLSSAEAQKCPHENWISVNEFDFGYKIKINQPEHWIKRAIM